MQLLALLIIALTVWLIIKRYQTHATLFLSGFALLTLAYIFSRFTGDPVPGLEESLTGWFGFDLFAIVKERLSTRVATIGMIIMAAGGFARYMSAISASGALVKAAIRPIGHIRNPYLLLSLAYAIGQTLNVFVPSAAGLAMLLLVAMFPTLVKLGVRPVAAAAVIGTTACLDLGPASPASNVAATVSEMKPIVYFVQYQIPMALIVIPSVAILHYIWQKVCDRRMPKEDAEQLSVLEASENPDHPVPGFYAILPVLPLILLLLFSPLVIQSIQLDVVTAMLISLFLSMACEAFRLKSFKEALKGIMHFFKGMGDIFATVVTLIIAAETFAAGVTATGLIASLIDTVGNNDLGSFTMVIALVLLIGFTAMLTGSGNAALFSFSHMIPGIAGPMGVGTVWLMLPAQLAAGLFRSMSPVAGVIIAVSSAANVSPFAIIKRTSVPMLGGVVVMLIAHAIIG
jgi:DcuC family C4-dicarboxylate transporter